MSNSKHVVPEAREGLDRFKTVSYTHLRVSAALHTDGREALALTVMAAAIEGSADSST